MKPGATHQIIPFRAVLVVLIVLWSTATAVSLEKLEAEVSFVANFFKKNWPEIRSLWRTLLHENFAWSNGRRQYFNTILLC